MKTLFKNREISFSAVTGLSLLIGFLLSFVDQVPTPVSLALYVNAYIFGSYFMLKNAVTVIKKFSFDIDLLMFVAAIGAAILDKWEEGALLLFLFSLGNALEKHALQRASRSIESLAELAPRTALLKTGNEIKEVPVDEVKAGDLLVIKPNSKISADGIVVKGSSSIDQASITGESMPADKIPLENFGQYHLHDLQNIDQRHKVFSGTINGDGYLEIIAAKEAKDSTLAKLIRLVHEAKEQHSHTQRFTHSFEKYFVPIVLAFVFLLNFAFLVIDETFKESFYRAITVLVVASPCALVISTPSTILSGIARAARKGVLFKGGRPLEDLAIIKALAFDKTGTLTKGEAKITNVVTLNGSTKEELMQMVLSIETHSNHPLAKAIVKEGTPLLKNARLREIENFRSITGMGVKASLSGQEISIGNRDMFEADPHLPEILTEQLLSMENEGKTCVIVKRGNTYEGILGLMDTPRSECTTVVQSLKSIGIERISLLSGDNQRVADSVGKQIGIEDVWGNLLPEDKVKAIQTLKAEEKSVAMVGDGVNDAPAMANSTVGIAMGAAGSDVALETADVALMSDKLSNLTFAIGLSRMTRKIIRQNLFISLGVIAVMIPLTMFGIASIGPAVLIHEGSTVVVVFNALRLLSYDEKQKPARKRPI